MTNNEAAKWIQLYIDLAKIDPTTGEAAYLNDDDKKTIEAMEMAVNTLIREVCNADNPTCNDLATNLQPSKQDADDLISRAAAINAHYEYCNQHPDAGFPVWSLKILKDLPSVQPEKCTEERTETHACDFIDRQEAIRIVDGIDTWQAGWRGDAIESMKALPPAQPEIVRCNDCLMHGVCRFEQGLGLDGYCSQAESRTDGSD